MNNLQTPSLTVNPGIIIQQISHLSDNLDRFIIKVNTTLNLWHQHRESEQKPLLPEINEEGPERKRRHH